VTELGFLRRGETGREGETERKRERDRERDSKGLNQQGHGGGGCAAWAAVEDCPSVDKLTRS
jgi:hypothetical protein